MNVRIGTSCCVKSKMREVFWAIRNLHVLQHVFLALILRLIFVLYGEWHDSHFEVKYTDIDYHVFTDGARLVTNNSSPFDRDTYRYTPVLAYLLVPNVLLTEVWGKVLFSLFDVYSGYLVYRIAKHGSSNAISKWCAVSWLYNPLPLVISTRGSAEAIISFLTLATVQFLLYDRIVAAAIVYGFAVHFKLYPAFYALAFYLALSSKTSKETVVWKVIGICVPNKKQLVFVITTVSSFTIPTYLAFRTFGLKYWEEAFYYHLTRKDIRHNFSPLFYMLYLLDEENYKWLSVITFVPQIVLLLLFSLGFKTRTDLPFCLFIQTFMFVALNKVCTSQYFLWYLCLMPAIIPSLCIGLKKAVCMLFVWLFGQMLWLYFAFRLEFKGMNCFFLIWISSLIFYISNMWLLKELIICYKNKG